MVRRDYVANGGWETFLSYEDPDQDILIGLLRLRKCSEETFRFELGGGVSIVRELHVYGSVVPVSSRDPTKFQHQVSCFNWVILKKLPEIGKVKAAGGERRERGCGKEASFQLFWGSPSPCCSHVVPKDNRYTPIIRFKQNWFTSCGIE